MNEDEYIPISALQHYLYCPRQCALIHLEQMWTENVYTAEGRELHEKAHSNTSEKRCECKTVTGLLLSSESLGLTGQADVVEFHHLDDRWIPYPIEYKRGRPKDSDADRVQLCAEALCLEEMLGEDIGEGSLFYATPRRRQVVTFDTYLREQTRKTIALVHDLFRSGKTPPPLNISDKHCSACSLLDECLPNVSSRASSSRYLQSLLENI